MPDDRVFRGNVLGDTAFILAILAGSMAFMMALVAVAARLSARRRGQGAPMRRRTA